MRGCDCPDALKQMSIQLDGNTSFNDPEVFVLCGFILSKAGKLNSWKLE